MQVQKCVKFHCPSSTETLFSRGVESTPPPPPVIESQKSPAEIGLTKKNNLKYNDLRQMRASPPSLAIALFGSKPFSGSYLCSHFIKLIIVYLLTQYELSCNLIGSLDLHYQLILPFRSVMYTLKTGNSKSEVQSPKLV